MRIMLRIAGVLTILLAGCSKPAPSSQPPRASATENEPVEIISREPHSQEHRHTAPHGGTLIMIGDHAGQLEFVLDFESGTLTMYALDGEAENAVRLSSIGISMDVTVPGKPAFEIQLKPVENVLTGETQTSTSQYTAQSEELKGVTEFNAVIPELAFRGMEIENLEVPFPAGSE